VEAGSVIPLTPERLAAVYECLREFPPYKNLKLPMVGVEFKVLKTKQWDGDYIAFVGSDEHILRISRARHSHFGTLASSVGHEMLHLYQERAGTVTTPGAHNEEFLRLAKRACQTLGWDYGQFV
jgi:hypothetical protein